MCCLTRHEHSFIAINSQFWRALRYLQQTPKFFGMCFLQYILQMYLTSYHGISVPVYSNCRVNNALLIHGTIM